MYIFRCTFTFIIFFFFFFQAEDGIRDRTVTGVQTCALPILVSTLVLTPEYSHGTPESLEGILDIGIALLARGSVECQNHFHKRRSEERRVGKECRSWMSRYY